MLYFDGGLPYERCGEGLQIPVEVLHRSDGVAVLNMPSLLMVDYDLPSDRHLLKASQTGKSLEHLCTLLRGADALWEKYGLPPGPATWRIHRTAGGYHAFRMDAPIVPDKAACAVLEALNCDPGYVSLVRNTQYWPIRVSRKSADEVAVYTVVEEIFGGEVECDECRAQIKVYAALVVSYADH